MSSPTPAPITSPYAADLAEVRAWLEKMIKALRFVEMVAAVLALIGRMRDVNFELAKHIGDARKARPKSETLRRLERQQVFPFMLLVPVAAKATTESDAPEPEPKPSRKGRHPGRAAPPAHLPRVPVPNPVPPEQRICPLCGRTMITVDHNVCEILEVEPARVYVIERMDERVACPYDDTIVSAKTPPQIVERRPGYDGAGSRRGARACKRSSGRSWVIRSGSSSRRRAFGQPFTMSFVTTCR